MNTYNTYNSSDFRIIKDGNSYTIISNTAIYGEYTLTAIGCEKESFIEQGFFSSNKFKLSDLKEGQYLLAIVDRYKVRTDLYISHYPSILNRVLLNLEKLLCIDCNNKKEVRPCITQEEENFLLFGRAYAQVQYLCNIIIPFKLGSSTDIIKDFLTASIRNNKCEFLSLFCKDELNYKIKGESKNVFTAFNTQLLGLYYLALYYYNCRIVDETNIESVNKIFNYYTIKKCLIKLGLDLTRLELLFEELVLEDQDLNIVCSVDEIVGVLNPELKVYNFATNKNISGVYDVVPLVNDGIDTATIFTTTLFNNGNIKVEAKVAKNPASVNVNEKFETSILLSGKQPYAMALNVPYKINGNLINTYRLIFSDNAGNNAPHITSFIKTLEYGEFYTFKIQDFEEHFIDIDGDALQAIALVGDTSNFFLGDTPYLAGTKIDRLNISRLKYVPSTQADSYNLTVEWKAWDSLGLENN